MKTAIGTFNSRSWVQTITLQPYERYELGRGDGTIGLADADCLPAVQIIADGRGTKLRVGASLPLSGHKRYVRNPYGVEAQFSVLFGAPIQLVAEYENATNDGWDYRQKSQCMLKVNAASAADERRAIMFLPKRGRHIFRANMVPAGNAALVPAAQLAYLAGKPAGVLDDVPPPVTRSDGSENTDIEVISGVYTDASIAAWIAAASWQYAPVDVQIDRGFAGTTLDTNTALICYSGYNSAYEVTTAIYDQGDFDIEGVW